MPDAKEPDQHLQVLQWRYEQCKRELEKRGDLNKLEARMFADSDADLGELRRLLERGCPPRLAVRILI